MKREHLLKGFERIRIRNMCRPYRETIVNWVLNRHDLSW